jgi:hypothetical protein
MSRRYSIINVKLGRAEDTAMDRLARRYPERSRCALIRMAIRVLDEATAPINLDDDSRHGDARDAATREASQHETPAVVVTSPPPARFMHRAKPTAFLHATEIEEPS